MGKKSGKSGDCKPTVGPKSLNGGDPNKLRSGNVQTTNQSAPSPNAKAKSLETECSDIQLSKRGARQSSGVSLRKISEGLQQLSPDAVRLLRELYSILDSDGSGTVSRQSFKDMMLSVGVSADSQKLDQMLARTGEPVSFAAYLAVMSESVSPLPARDELEGMFGAFENAEGAIDAKELVPLLREQGVDDKEIDRVLEKFGKKTPKGIVFDAKSYMEIMTV